MPPSWFHAAKFHAVEVPEARHQFLEVHLIVEKATVERIGEIGGHGCAAAGRGRESKRVRRRETVGAARLRRAVEIDGGDGGHPSDRIEKAAERPHHRERRGRSVARRESLSADGVVVRIGVKKGSELPLELKKEAHEALQAI